ncbi:MAG: transglycosylase domain-containing protein [Candidatus Pacebacteria bacterium]|jgi:membrane carboxypeptidase/penicillin-binding protein PbpC|nr:transglycosylase domain-containing protein [Candidatus Paceibacterota bacterium]
MRLRVKILAFFIFAAAATVFCAFFSGDAVTMQKEYEARRSPKVFDRAGIVMFLRPNHLGYYSDYAPNTAPEIEKLLIAKEDKYFYWHFGINPAGIIADLARRLGFGGRAGASTITQQTAKMMLGHENERTVANKMSEAAAALGLEMTRGKKRILEQYGNLVYLGNRLQGFTAASRAYFGVSPESLSQAQIFQLLATISDPSGSNPAADNNIEQAKLLAKNLGRDVSEGFMTANTARDNLRHYFDDNTALFELRGQLDVAACQGDQKTTLDPVMNAKLREIISRNLQQLDVKKAKNAAALVISLPDNGILALSGSPDPDSTGNGYQINMLQVPRQIGSTIKPFIYLKAFEKGARPHTLIDDREYKYAAGEDFAFYPENYDRTYRGKITAHYALANSINVAAAKALEFDGINDFGRFITEDLGIQTQQDVSTYQMGIAMGTMETDIVTLAQAFTVFPNNGRLDNLRLFENNSCNSARYAPRSGQVSKKIYIELVNKILADRAIAQDQFGARSALNLPAANYALKTGTSHDYTDSWVIGYTPDFLVAVWVGNADATAMEGVSGQVGAGKIWADIMEMMLASEYDKKTPLDFSDIVEYPDGATIQYGLENDDYETSKNIILKMDGQLILKPHNNDIYEFTPEARLVLRSSEPATWTINGKDIGAGQELVYAPPGEGRYTISADTGGRKEEILIEFVKK